MSRSLYYGHLAGCLSVLLSHGKITIEQSHAILKLKGLKTKMVETLIPPASARAEGG